MPKARRQKRGRDSGAAIAIALRTNTTLTSVDLSNTGLDAATQRRIDDALARIARESAPPTPRSATSAASARTELRAISQ